jgi:hypothetical protein
MTISIFVLPLVIVTVRVESSQPTVAPRFSAINRAGTTVRPFRSVALWSSVTSSPFTFAAGLSITISIAVLPPRAELFPQGVSPVEGPRVPPEPLSGIRPVPLQNVQLTQPLLQLKLEHGLPATKPFPSQVRQVLPPVPLQVVHGRSSAYTVAGTQITNNITIVSKIDNAFFILKKPPKNYIILHTLTIIIHSGLFFKSHFFQHKIRFAGD